MAPVSAYLHAKLHRRPAFGHDTAVELFNLSLLAPPGGAKRTPAGWAFFLSVAVVVLKTPDALRLPQFWAEDGAVFFSQQWGHLIPRIFVPYGGYLNVIPRTVAWLATAVPVVYAPMFYVVASILISAAGITSLRQMERIGMPFGLTLTIFALTPTSGEILGILTNVQWTLQFCLLAFLVRFACEDTGRQTVMGSIAMLAVALTGPFASFACAALFGIAISRWVMAPSCDRDVKGALRSLAFAEAICLMAGAGIQLAVVWSSNVVPTGTSASLAVGIASELAAWQIHVFGMRVISDGLFLSSFFVLFLTAAGVQIRRHGAVPFAAIVCFALLELLSVAVKFSNQPGILSFLDNGDRYFVLLKIVFWWSLLWSIGAVAASRTAVGVGLASIIAISVWTAAPLRGRPLPDLEWTRYAAVIQSGVDVVVPLNPTPWTMSIHRRRPATGH